jgi:hypothetical protein
VAAPVLVLPGLHVVCDAVDYAVWAVFVVE